MISGANQWSSRESPTPAAAVAAAGSEGEEGGAVAATAGATSENGDGPKSLPSSDDLQWDTLMAAAGNAPGLPRRFDSIEDVSHAIGKSLSPSDHWTIFNFVLSRHHLLLLTAAI